MSAKSAIKNGGAGNPPEESWTAGAAATVPLGGDPHRLQNALKGVGFFLGVLLLTRIRASPPRWRPWLRLACSPARQAPGAAREIGRMQQKPAFLSLFSTSAGINIGCRCPFLSLCCAADVWFVGGAFARCSSDDPGLGRFWEVAASWALWVDRA